MAIAFRSASARFEGTSGTTTPAMPSGWQINDFLCAHITHSSSATIATPSGWNAGVTIANTANTYRTAMFWKFAASGQTSPAVTTNTAGGWGILSAFSGVPVRANPFEVAPSATNGSGVTMTGAAMTITDPGSMAVWLWSQFDNGVNSTVTNSATIMYGGSNYDSIVGNDASHGAACKVIGSAGSTGTTNMTSASGAVWANMRFALDPTPVAATEITGDFFLMGF